MAETPHAFTVFESSVCLGERGGGGGAQLIYSSAFVWFMLLCIYI